MNIVLTGMFYKIDVGFLVKGNNLNPNNFTIFSDCKFIIMKLI